MHEVLVNRLGGLGLPRKSVVRLTDRPDTTLDVYRGGKTTKTTYSLKEAQLLKKIIEGQIISFKTKLRRANSPREANKKS